MAQKDTMEALRAIAGRADGYKCYYCQVPTAATIEHLHPRSDGGVSWAKNVVLACPYCNQKKGNRDIEQFKKEAKWKIKIPEDLEKTTCELLKNRFGFVKEEGFVYTNSPHSKLEISDNLIYLYIRPGKKYDWIKIKLGPEDHPRVAWASYDFLTRHFTPKEPKKFVPKKAYRKF